MLNRKPLRGSFGLCIPFPPVAAYGVNWGLLARTPTGFIHGAVTHSTGICKLHKSILDVLVDSP